MPKLNDVQSGVERQKVAHWTRLDTITRAVIGWFVQRKLSNDTLVKKPARKVAVALSVNSEKIVIR
jgi:hypothetical protein